MFGITHKRELSVETRIIKRDDFLKSLNEQLARTKSESVATLLRDTIERVSKKAEFIEMPHSPEYEDKVIAAMEGKITMGELEEAYNELMSK